mmetsp:Transcript_88888/g.252011  ORF Transcript_88888/g.252011 Transcript_88888/m.252011 type:complete len:494 (+) Transcript_88888:71-1552(+)
MGCSGSTQIGLPHKRVSSQLNDLQKKNIKEGGIEYSQFIMCNRGKITDYYEIEKNKLGEGSYGSVSKARNKETCAARAIKSIPKSKMKNFEQFKREISIMKLMDHPNIIKLYETFEDHRCLYLVMELCTGGELFDRIIEAGHFTEVQAAIVMQHIFRAINYMHEVHVCHRDLKPENFLLISQGPIDSKNVLKIIDFGLACRSEPGRHLTESVGTAYYASPQVLECWYDHKCDLWSCGVIMYILLSGRPPFAGKRQVDVVRKVAKGSWGFRGDEWKDVSKSAKDLVTLLLQRDPCNRPAAEQALEHRWIKRTAPQMSFAPVQKSFLKNLCSFKSQSKVKKAALKVIVRQLSERSIRELRETFTTFDTDKDGLLTLGELSTGLKRRGFQKSKSELQQIMDSMDDDGDGIVNYTEFLAATLDRRRHLREHVCWNAFNAFDLDGDGTITKDDLEFMLDTECIGEDDLNFEDFMEVMKGGHTPHTTRWKDQDKDVSFF